MSGIFKISVGSSARPAEDDKREWVTGVMNLPGL